MENQVLLDITKKSIEKKFDSNIKIDKTKLLRLKNSLERLINPNQSYDEQSFKIFINVIDELNEDSSTPYHEKVTGEVKNQIFEKLDFKTTFIESFISEDGSKIVTELKDKNETIFRLIEKNIDFPLLKDIKITIYYLNPYAKGFFKKQTGIAGVDSTSLNLSGVGTSTVTGGADAVTVATLSGNGAAATYDMTAGAAAMKDVIV